MTKYTPAEVAEALEHSIQHWERLASGTSGAHEGLTPKDCALCRLFYYTPGASCIGCPVMLHTGFAQCRNTPYQGAAALHKCSFDKDEPEFKLAASLEVNFLKSLRQTIAVASAVGPCDTSPVSKCQPEQSSLVQQKQATIEDATNEGNIETEGHYSSGPRS